MGVDCKGLLKGEISTEEVANVISKKLGAEITNIEFVKPYEYVVKEKLYYGKCGYIFFNYKDESRMMQVYYSSYQGDMDDKGVDCTHEYTQLVLGYNDNAIEIMRLIIPEFGGYIDESDCDDIGYELIKKNGDESIKPVIHIKLKDLYEKYGGIVVIDDYNS